MSAQSHSTLRGLVSLISGILFGVGLTLSGMVNPAKVLNFLDFAGSWDPTLALVFGGALLVALPGYQWVLANREQPVLAEKFELPSNSSITPSLIAGAALFGAGWGLGGFCPGPGLTALVSLDFDVLLFVLAMFAGAATYKFGFSGG